MNARAAAAANLPTEPVPPPPEPPAPAAALPSTLDVRSVALSVIAALALILMLQYAQAVVIPIVLAVLISYALDPGVTLLARVRVPRALAAAVLLLAVVSAGGALVYELSYEAQEIVRQLPEAARRVRQRLERSQPTTTSAIQQVQQAATELEKAAGAAAAPPRPAPNVQKVQVEAAPVNIQQYLLYGSLGVAGALGQLIVILFLSFFLLASGDLYRRKLVKIAGPSLTEKRITLQILADIDRQIEWFLLVQVFTSTIVGVATWLAFRWIGLQQAGVWGLLAGIFNSIPYLGPFLVSGGTAIIAFLQFGSLRMMIIAAGLALVITSLEGLLLTPWLTSRAARMNAVAIFVGLLFWGWVWSVWGMLLAVPMLMVLKSICDHVEDLKGIGELLGE